MLHHSKESFDAPAERLTRRRLFGLIPLPLLAGCTAAVAVASEPDDDEPDDDASDYRHSLEGWLIPIPGHGHWTLNPETEVMELVPRWEVPSVCSAPQPEPIDVAVRVLSDRYATIARTWKAGDARHCRLCLVCRAEQGMTGRDVCMTVAHPMTVEEARMWSEQPKGGAE